MATTKKAAKATATEPTETSMELIISVEGKIISSNFDAFRDYAKTRIQEINFDLTTDDDFNQASEDAKMLDGFEKLLASKEEEMLKSLDDVYLLITGSRELKKLSAEKRIALTKAVKDRREAVIDSMIQQGIKNLVLDVEPFRTQIKESVKGKKSFGIMSMTITDLVNAINRRVETNREYLATIEAAHGSEIVYGPNELLRMDPEVLAKEIDTRIERMKAAIEKKKLQEENDRMKREAAAQQPAPAPQPTAPAALPPTQAPASNPIEKTEQDAEKEELESFINTVKTGFAPFKAARESLVFPLNRERANAFAVKMNAAWMDFINY